MTLRLNTTQLGALATLLESSDIAPDITEAVADELARARARGAQRGRTYERPVRRDGGMHDDYREEHPAYAMIGASRVSSTPGEYLCGSDFRHGNYVTITIRRSDLSRGISHDHHGIGQELLEVAISEAQWATFVSAMNVGGGVPATLRYTVEDGFVPGIAPDTDRRTQARDEVRARLRDAEAAIEEAMAAVAAAALSAKAKKDLTDKLDRAQRQMGPNLDFAVETFDRHTEATVEKAKIEVAAYLTSAVQRAGLEALIAQGQPPLLELVEGDTAGD